MYKIIFKGVGIEPMFVDDNKGKIVMESWVGDKKARMVLGNTAFFTGDIKQITKLEKSEAEVAAQTPNLVEQQYLEFRQKMLGLSIEKRATIMRIAKMIWNSHTKAEMPDDLKEQIKARQLTYFTENPNCIYANPKVYKDLIPKFLPLAHLDDFKPIQNVVPKLTLKMVEQLVQTDLQYSIR